MKTSPLKLKFLSGLVAVVATVACLTPSLATITSTTTKTISALGNGITTNYTIGFTFLDNNDIEVYLKDEATTPATETLLVYGAGAGKYTITGGNPGTTVVLGTAPSATQRVVIRRAEPKTQTVDYVDTDAFPADDHEEQMDRMTMVIQQLSEEISRAPKFQKTSSTANIPMPEPSGLAVLQWNNLGTALQNVSLNSIVSTSGGLISSNNLSDVSDPAASRTNLGLGTAALSDAADFEPADPAIQAHIANMSNPHNVTAAQVGNDTAQWNADRIQGVTVDDSNKANGRVLSFNSTSGNIEYIDQATGGGGTFTSPTTTKGDMIARDSSADVRLPVGTNGQVLTADSTQTTGIKWATPSAGFSNPMTTLGDIMFEDSTPAAARLAGNTTTTKKYLSQTGNGSVSAAPTWSQPAFSELSGNPTVAQVHTVTGSPGSPQSITAAGGITSTAAIPFQTIFVQGSGGAVTISANPQISAGTVVGQIMHIVGTSDTNTLTISDGTGVSSNGPRTHYANSASTWMWNGSVWSEIAWRQ